LRDRVSGVFDVTLNACDHLGDIRPFLGIGVHEVRIREHLDHANLRGLLGCRRRFQFSVAVIGEPHQRIRDRGRRAVLIAGVFETGVAIGLQKTRRVLDFGAITRRLREKRDAEKCDCRDERG
jgi:hypothetical protein